MRNSEYSAGGDRVGDGEKALDQGGAGALSTVTTDKEKQEAQALANKLVDAVKAYYPQKVRSADARNQAFERTQDLVKALSEHILQTSFSSVTRPP